jgi:hypothetical protein
MNLSIQDLRYTKEPVSEGIWDAAKECSMSCAFDPDDEFCLGSVVGHILLLDPESAQESFPEYLEAHEAVSDRLVRIDWQSWSTPRSFSQFVQGSLVQRSEAVVVSVRALLAGEVEPSALIHWQEIDELQAVPPRSVFEDLSRLILGEWSDEIGFYATSGTNFVDQLDPFIRPALREVLLLD